MNHDHDDHSEATSRGPVYCFCGLYALSEIDHSFDSWSSGPYTQAPYTLFLRNDARAGTPDLFSEQYFG